MDDQESQTVCRGCGRPLRIGHDALCVQRCVIGPRGIVPVEEPLLYCDESCMQREPDGDSITRLRRRIP